MDHPALERGIQAARAGRPQEARALLSQVVRDEPANEQAWLWLSAVVEGDEQKRYCLQRVLALNPHNQAAARGLELLASSTPPPSAAPVPVAAAEAPAAPPTPPPARPEEKPGALRPATEPVSKPPPAGLLGRLGLSPLLAGLAAVLVVLIVVILAIIVIRNITVARAPAGPAVAQAPPPTVPLATPAVRPTRPTTTPTPAPTATPTMPPTPLLADTTCPFDPAPGLRVECYDLEVVEDRAGDPADTIQLAVVRVHGAGISRSPYPLVFLQGGPGAGAIEYIVAISTAGGDWFYPFLQGRDLIVFDQRGVGYSRPNLQCFELLEAYRDDVIEEWSPEQREDGYMAALHACRDRLIRAGANLSAYTTAASAADVVDILDALGYEQADLYGVSYGTRLALAVMRDHPERVHSAVLDSSLPLQTSIYLQLAELEDVALQALFAGCAADSACQAAYPDLEQAYQEVANRLDAEPVSVRFRNYMADGMLHAADVDGTWLRDALAWGMRIPSVLGIVPQTIYDARAGDYSPLAYLLGLQNYGYSGLDLGVYISIECGEEILPLSPEELAAAAGRGGEDNVVLSGLDESSLLVAACQDWGIAAVAPRERAPLASAIPTLILAGQYDSITPPVLGEEVVETLSQGYLFVVPGGGHVPSMDTWGDCPRAIIRAFLADPTSRPDGSCLDALDAAPFTIPSPATDVRLEPFVDDVMGVAGVRPAGWAVDARGSGDLYRRSWLVDPTRVAVQGAVASVDYWVQYLATNFLDSGFDEDPRPAGQRRANGLTWHLYTALSFQHPVDIALAEGSKRTILVLMVSEPREHDIMYELVFIPMVDAAVER